MFITGPNVIAQVTGEQVTSDELGGADAHMALSGVTHFVADDDEQAILIAKKLLSFLPQNNTEDPPDRRPRRRRRARPRAGRDRPGDGQEGVRRPRGHRPPRRPRRLPRGPGGLRRQHRGRLRPDHRAHGRRRRQPADGALRRARHQRLGQGVGVHPVLQRLQHPAGDARRRARASCPASPQEHDGIIRHGAKLLFAYSAATVPKITVVLRKAYGGAYVAMCSKDLGADQVLRLADRRDRGDGRRGCRRDRVPPRDRRAPRTRRPSGAELIEEYRSTFSTPYVAAARGLVDDIIDPARTREHVSQGAGDADHQAHHPAGQEARAGPDVSEPTVPPSRRVAELLEPSARSPSGSRTSRPRWPSSAGRRRSPRTSSSRSRQRSRRSSVTGRRSSRCTTGPAPPGPSRAGPSSRAATTSTGRGRDTCSSR